MNLKNKKKRMSTIGRRTGYDVRAGKRIRVNKYGMEHFDDYWTSSSEGDSNASNPSPLFSSPVGKNVPRMSSFIKNMNHTPRQELLAKISYAVTPKSKKGSNEKQVRKSVVSKQIAERRQLFAKGRRTGADMFAGKKMQNINGVNNFDNYWTDSDALSTICGSKTSNSGFSATKNTSPKISNVSHQFAEREKRVPNGTFILPQSSGDSSIVSDALTSRASSHSRNKNNGTPNSVCEIAAVDPKERMLCNEQDSDSSDKHNSTLSLEDSKMASANITSRGNISVQNTTASDLPNTFTGTNVLVGKEIQNINKDKNSDYWADGSLLNNIHGSETQSNRATSTNHASHSKVLNIYHKSVEQEHISNETLNLPQTPGCSNTVFEAHTKSSNRRFRNKKIGAHNSSVGKIFAEDTRKKMLCNEPDSDISDKHNSTHSVKDSKMASADIKSQTKSNASLRSRTASPRVSSESNSSNASTGTLAGKQIRNVNEIENSDDYWADNSSFTSMNDHKTLSNRASKSNYTSLGAVLHIRRKSARQEHIPKETLNLPQSPANSNTVSETRAPISSIRCFRNNKSRTGDSSVGKIIAEDTRKKMLCNEPDSDSSDKRNSTHSVKDSKIPSADITSQSKRNASLWNRTASPCVSSASRSSNVSTGTLAGKEIQNVNRVENPNDYQADNSSFTSVCSHKTSSNRASKSNYTSQGEILNVRHKSVEQELFPNETLNIPQSLDNSNTVPKTCTPKSSNRLSRDKNIGIPNNSVGEIIAKNSNQRMLCNVTNLVENLGSGKQNITLEDDEVADIQSQSKINVSLQKKTASPCIPTTSQLSSTSTPKEKKVNQCKDNEIDVSSRFKKRKKKSTVLQQNVEVEPDVPQLRRSKRKRFPPMERWRLQRLRTVYDNFNIVTVEVEEGNEPITDEVDRIRRTMTRNHERYVESKKKAKSRKPKMPENTLNLKQVRKELTKTEVLDPITGEEKLVYLHRPHDTLLWSVPPLKDKATASYTIAKCYSGDLISFGFIEIGCGKEKNKQLSPEHNLAFYVIKGNNLKMTIHQSNFSLKELDFIAVPAGNTYSIVNKGKIDAILSFSTFKTPMFDYQFPDNMEDHD